MNKEAHDGWLVTEEGWRILRLEGWLKQLRRLIYPERRRLQARFADGDCSYADRLQLDYRPIQLGDWWGKPWGYGWFHLEGEVPGEWGGEPVRALVNLGGEATVFDALGEPAGRITNGSVFDTWYEVDEISLPASDSGERRVDLWIHAWASKLDGIFRPEDPARDGEDREGSYEARVTGLHLARVDRNTRDLYHDVEVLLGAARILPEFSAARARLLHHLFEALLIWKDEPLNSMAARAVLAPALQGTASGLEAVVTGHAHIDTGWLWRVKDSIGKCGRTFAAQVQNIEDFPGYVFGASSAQHYEFVRANFPRLHARIRELVQQGRWEIQSAMWVECDTNLPCGESLVRQFLYGADWIRREFAVECPIAWLPDVFGLSAALPQVLAQAGVKYFLTKKPHWGRATIFPHTTFRWVGHDGSEVLTHILPQERDYNGQIRPEDLQLAEAGFLEKGALGRFLYTMGVGDGGGGPSRPMLERAARMQSLEGLPRVRLGTALEVFEGFALQADQLPAWRGEIYVEGHRGTYTSQGKIKQANREAEVLLGQIEHLWCYAPAAAYPREKLAASWKKVLLHQFHDILPGSCIREVAEDAINDYEEVIAEAKKLIDEFSRQLPRSQDSVSFFNHLANDWEGCVEHAGKELGQADGLGRLSQREPDGTTVSRIKVPALGFSVAQLSGEAVMAEPLSEPVLENARLRCSFDGSGRLLECVDKLTGESVLEPGSPSNQLSLYIDRPVDWDAWDIDHLYQLEKSAEAVPNGPWAGWVGPARSVAEFPILIGQSTGRLRAILEADSSRVDFELTIDWKERHRMLRTGFTTRFAEPEMICGIQHGFVRRPSRPQTAAERAKFEVPFQGYAAALDGDQGGALLSVAKYGLRIEGGFLELALLRGPTFPDYRADEGCHRIRYSFLPLHGADALHEVQMEADRIAFHPLRMEGRDASSLQPLLHLDRDGTIRVEAVKRAEHSDDVIVRLANIGGVAGACRIETGAQGMSSCDILERSKGTLEIGARLALRPFELFTCSLAGIAGTSTFQRTKQAPECEEPAAPELSLV